MTKPRKHHFVQQAHLAKFAASDGKVFVCGSNGSVFETTPTNVFAKRDLYAYSCDDEIITDFEKVISQFENESFPEIEKVSKNGCLRNINLELVYAYIA